MGGQGCIRRNHRSGKVPVGQERGLRRPLGPFAVPLSRNALPLSAAARPPAPDNFWPHPPHAPTRRSLAQSRAQDWLVRPTQPALERATGAPCLPAVLGPS